MKKPTDSKSTSRKKQSPPLLREKKKGLSNKLYNDIINYGLDFAINQCSKPLRSQKRLITPNYIVEPDYKRLWGKPFNLSKNAPRPRSKSEHLKLFENYKHNRRLLSDFHIDTFRPGNIPERIINNAGEKLGICSEDGHIDIYSEVEMNVLYDYCTLYSYIDNRPFISDFLEKHPENLQEEAKEVVTAFVNSKFTILRFDALLDNGLIKVHDLANGENHILIDQALNNTTFEGCHLVVNLLDLKDYVMSSGGPISFDPKSWGGKHILEIFSKYLSSIKRNKQPTKDITVEYVTKIYNYCLTNCALHGNTANEV